MKVKILQEVGLDHALLGLSLNKNQPVEKMLPVLDKLAKHDMGHNKALEHITVYLDISAPRYWWSEFDTYRVGISKQSESTMHTITKCQLTVDDFEGTIVINDDLEELNLQIQHYNAHRHEDSNNDACFMDIKRLLPESFIQRRIICTNYKTLRNIYQQRYNHRLPEWKFFCNKLKLDLNNSNWLEK